MKRSVLIFFIAGIILLTTGLWIISSSKPVNPIEWVSFGVIFLVIVFALVFGYKRLTGVKRGEPAEDELSKKILRKTSSVSYYLSLYMWLILGYFSDKLEYETHTYIGAGILGMAITFAICWLVIKFTGLRNE